MHLNGVCAHDHWTVKAVNGLGGGGGADSMVYLAQCMHVREDTRRMLAIAALHHVSALPAAAAAHAKHRCSGATASWSVTQIDVQCCCTS